MYSGSNISTWSSRTLSLLTLFLHQIIVRHVENRMILILIQLENPPKINLGSEGDPPGKADFFLTPGLGKLFGCVWNRIPTVHLIFKYVSTTYQRSNLYSRPDPPYTPHMASKASHGNLGCVHCRDKFQSMT